MKNKVYVVYEAYAFYEQQTNVSADGDVYGVYTSLAEAKKALTECKEDEYFTISRLLTCNYHKDLDTINKSIEVSGGENMEYYTIRYTYSDGHWNEIYISIEEKVCK